MHASLPYVKRTHLNQFGPEFWPPAAVKAALTEAGWSDVSWGNDVCPSWERSDGHIVFFADAENPCRRELPALPRFRAYRQDGDALGMPLFAAEEVGAAVAYLFLNGKDYTK